MAVAQTQSPPDGEPFRWPPFCRHPELPPQPKPAGTAPGGRMPARERR